VVKLQRTLDLCDVKTENIAYPAPAKATRSGPDPQTRPHPCRGWDAGADRPQSLELRQQPGTKK